MVLRRIGLSGCSLRNLPQTCSGFALFAIGPQHFAQVRGDFVVGEALQGLAQQAFGFVEIAQAVIHPAEAVEHGRVFRIDLVGLFDQGLGFGIARGAVGQGVAERVECHGVVRVALDDQAQVFFHLRQVIAFFRLHGAGVQQVQIVRVLLQGLSQHIPGRVALIVGGQGFGFDQVQLNRVVRLVVACCGQAACWASAVLPLLIRMSA